VNFDRKEDFRSSFKEDRKSNEAPKKCRKQGEASHGRAPGCTAVLQRPGLHTTGRIAVSPTVPAARDCDFFLAIYSFLSDF